MKETTVDEVVNVDQAAAWDGDEGTGWAKDWERYDKSIRAYREPMLAAAAITDGERVLDVGCGNGQSARDAARATPTGSALGVDLSAAMLEQARRRAEVEGLHNIEFIQADAQVHPFSAGTFDLTISRFGSMFFADKPAAFANIGRALRSDGRLLLVVWQPVSVNEQFATIFDTLAAGRDLPKPPPTAPSPFGLSDPDLGRRWLTEAGFTDIDHRAVTGAFELGADADDAFAFARQLSVVQGLIGDLDDEASTAALAQLRDTAGRSTYTGEVMGRDLDTGEYVIIITFPSKEAADVNDALPETSALAQQTTALTTEGPSFSNIEVIDQG